MNHVTIRIMCNVTKGECYDMREVHDTKHYI